MSEARLCAGLVKSLRRTMLGCVLIRHTDGLVAGVPDISLTWYGRTTWIEVKYINPRIIHRGIQHLTLKRLAKQGTAFYVLYDSTGGPLTYVVAPEYLEDFRTRYTKLYSGHSHDLVSRFIREVHRGEDIEP